MRMRPLTMVPATSNVGAFVSVPDTKEHEDLARRVSALESLTGQFNTSYKAFESTFRAQVSQMNEFNTRLAQIEQKVGRLEGEVKGLSDRVQSHERTDLRRESILSSMQTEFDKLRNAIRRHERNEAMHSHDDDARHEPKGFQQNDQPARFMGANRF